MAMAKIGDELKRIANSDIVCGHTWVELIDLADRIDSEMVELPRDKDGATIRVGDTVWMADKGALELAVTSITLHACGAVNVDASCEGCHAHVSPSDLTHNRPDSWRRIADELEEWSEDNRVNVDSEIFDRAADFADRIRRLADLIDPTCTVVSERAHAVGFGCEEAGTEFTLSCGHDVIVDGELPPRYCDECGARVVSDDD